MRNSLPIHFSSTFSTIYFTYSKEGEKANEKITLFNRRFMLGNIRIQ